MSVPALDTSVVQAVREMVAFMHQEGRLTSAPSSPISWVSKILNRCGAAVRDHSPCFWLASLVSFFGLLCFHSIFYSTIATAVVVTLFCTEWCMVFAFRCCCYQWLVYTDTLAAWWVGRQIGALEVQCQAEPVVCSWTGYLSSDLVGQQN